VPGRAREPRRAHQQRRRHRDADERAEDQRLGTDARGRGRDARDRRRDHPERVDDAQSPEGQRPLEHRLRNRGDPREQEERRGQRHELRDPLAEHGLGRRLADHSDQRRQQHAQGERQQHRHAQVSLVGGPALHQRGGQPVLAGRGRHDREDERNRDDAEVRRCEQAGQDDRGREGDDLAGHPRRAGPPDGVEGRGGEGLAFDDFARLRRGSGHAPERGGS
jgi:hypothetical protein